MLKFSRKNESGRSMVEMLGVLAIIGVLSVMGIAGYTQAMRSHKANEIVNATAICYMLGMAQNAGTGNANLTYAPTPSGVSSVKFTTENKVEIEGISDKELCEQVKGKIGDKASGDCSSPYKLTVTFGDTTAVGEEESASSNILKAEDIDMNQPCIEGKIVCYSMVQNGSIVYSYSYVMDCDTNGSWDPRSYNPSEYKSLCPVECTPGETISSYVACDSDGYWTEV